MMESTNPNDNEIIEADVQINDTDSDTDWDMNW